MRSLLALCAALLLAAPTQAIPPPAPLEHVLNLDQARARGLQIEIEPGSPHCFAGTAVRVLAPEHWQRKPIASAQVENVGPHAEPLLMVYAEKLETGRLLRFCVHEMDRERSSRTSVLVLGYSGATMGGQYEFLRISIPILTRGY